MATVAALDDVRHLRQLRPRTEVDQREGHSVWRTDFIGTGGKSDVGDTPQAFLIEGTPNRLLRTHFHEVDQFQVIVGGDGTLAKHDLGYGGVHFARAFTPYGPITNGKEGLSFLTLRARRDPEYAQFIPEKRARLEEVKRTPWQVTKAPQFSGGQQFATLAAIDGLKDENGLAAYSLTMPPGSTIAAPNPAGTDGQYIVVLSGSLTDCGRAYPGLTVGFVGPDEPPYVVKAGPDGLRGLVLCFPRPQAGAGRGSSHGSAKSRVMHCALCAAVYDEAAGSPHDGIPPGTRWEDVPSSWTCPDCGATKDDFHEAGS